jgi:phosphatidylglycerophosphate synthase
MALVANAEVAEVSMEKIMVIYGTSVIIAFLCLITSVISIAISIIRRRTNKIDEPKAAGRLNLLSLIFMGVVICIMLFIAVSSPSVLESDLFVLIQPTILAVVSVATSILVTKRAYNNNN